MLKFDYLNVAVMSEIYLFCTCSLAQKAKKINSRKFIDWIPSCISRCNKKKYEEKPQWFYFKYEDELKYKG